MIYHMFTINNWSPSVTSELSETRPLKLRGSLAWSLNAAKAKSCRASERAAKQRGILLLFFSKTLRVALEFLSRSTNLNQDFDPCPAL